MATVNLFWRESHASSLLTVPAGGAPLSDAPPESA